MTSNQSDDVDSNGIPTCFCLEYWKDHHPECPTRTTVERLRAEVDRLRAALRRVIGEHHAPRDCYSSGPLTETALDDVCPACDALRMLDGATAVAPAARAALDEVHRLSQEIATETPAERKP